MWVWVYVCVVLFVACFYVGVFGTRKSRRNASQKNIEFRNYTHTHIHTPWMHLCVHRGKMPKNEKRTTTRNFCGNIFEQAKEQRQEEKNNRQVDQKCQGCDEAVKDRLYRLLLPLFDASKQRQQQQQRWKNRQKTVCNKIKTPNTNKID